MKQFRKILSFELKYYLKNKVFVGVTVFMVLALAVVMFFPRLNALLSKDDTAPQELPVMLVASAAPEYREFVLDAFTAAFPGYEVKISDSDPDSIRQKIRSGDAECAFLLKDLTQYTYCVDNITLTDANTQVAEQVLQNVYRMNAMVNGGMTPEQAQQVMNFQVQGEVENMGTDQVKNFFYTYIMIFALYMVILMYGQMVATNVASEKSSRAMELLITSARPTSMMFGKVIASCLAGLIQLLATFGSALLFYNLNRNYWDGNMIMDSLFDMPPALLAYMLAFFVLGFFIYAFLYGAIGSTASRLEDINTSVMPITVLFVIAFMVVMFSLGSGNVDNLLMRICSFIPFTSPMAMFTRIAMSTVPWYEIAISMVILAGSVIGVGVLSAKIYRVGVLLYGTPPKIGAILKAIRSR